MTFVRMSLSRVMGQNPDWSGLRNECKKCVGAVKVSLVFLKVKMVPQNPGRDITSVEDSLLSGLMSELVLHAQGL